MRAVGLTVAAFAAQSPQCPCAPVDFPALARRTFKEAGAEWEELIVQTSDGPARRPLDYGTPPRLQRARKVSSEMQQGALAGFGAAGRLGSALPRFLLQ